MNQLRLYNQCNFIEVFDSLDNNFFKDQNFLIFKVKNYLHIYNKIENLNISITIRNSLLLEALSCQRFFFIHKRNSKKKVLLFTKVTIRDNKFFLLLETLLHSVLLMQQSKINLQKLKVPSFDFFFQNKVLNKLSMQILRQNYFIITY
uniref:Uncharacterized protein n=1 Tax=Gracilaria tenuistipitata TaxID=2510778 RepID=A0A2S1PUR0_GRATE|nr:hypothetical protein GrtenORF01 [Gracilaria tenuistipitata]ARU07665.1 hypothetical protein [Gracilaria tenuistipitata]AWH62566.1 hypothetical protein GrtenORF01 [Gracilaria tenuistipitata]